MLTKVQVHTIISSIAFSVVVLLSASSGVGQNLKARIPAEIRYSAAFAEVLLRETELKAELESLLLEYTEEYPKVKEIRAELELLSSESDRLLSTKPAESYKLTDALGKLILGKVLNQSKLRQLRLQFADDHPSVRRQRRKVEIYEAAIKEILL